MVMLLTSSCIGIAEANDKTMETEFVYMAPYLGSIRDVYPSATIQTYQTDSLSYGDKVSGDSFSKVFDYLYGEHKNKLFNMCNKLNGKYKKVYYGFDNISASERQKTDITTNYSGGTSYETGQDAHLLFNMYCATSE